MVWNAISFRHGLATSTDQIDLLAIIGKVIFNILNLGSPTQYYWTIIGFRLAYLLMIFLSRENELFLAGKTFELLLIQQIHHESVCPFSWNKIFSAVWACFTPFCPVSDAFLAIQPVTSTAFQRIRCYHILADCANETVFNGVYGLLRRKLIQNILSAVFSLLV